MKKQTIIKLIIIMLLVIPVILLSGLYIDYNRYNIDHVYSTEIDKYLDDLFNQEGTILMNHYLDIECDGFYIIRPYISRHEKHELVGVKWYSYQSFSDYLFGELLFNGENLAEDKQELVFINNQEVAGIALLNRKNGDFVNLTNVYHEINTIFYKVNNGYGYYTIVLTE